METLGLDIGTTTISAVVYDSNMGVLTSRTIRNDSFLTGQSWERIQDPCVIYEKSLSVVRELLSLYPDVAAIGLSGQMHGILYLDDQGEPVSPLFIWQDGRGDLPYDEHCSWAAHLSALTGYALATGYGMVTHYYNLNHNLVPPAAAKLCTIHDYLAMKFSGRTVPVTEATDAASLGLYDGPHHRFDPDALAKAGIDSSMLPEVVTELCLGTGMLDIPVFAALGDNQASFLGATGGQTDVLLVNMGTGGQVSVYSSDYIQTQTLETRPFPDGGWLLVGASLCGGRSYALLETFFRDTVKMVTGQDVSAYDAMAKAMEASPDLSTSIKVTTLFQGTRKDPTLRGSIQNIGADNFTPAHFIHGVMQGMADELYTMYDGYLALGGKPPVSMVGSGNGLRKNPHLCRIFETTFGVPLLLSQNDEEAACGAAIYAAKHCS